MPKKYKYVDTRKSLRENQIIKSSWIRKMQEDLKRAGIRVGSKRQETGKYEEKY